MLLFRGSGEFGFGECFRGVGARGRGVEYLGGEAKSIWKILRNNTDDRRCLCVWVPVCNHNLLQLFLQTLTRVGRA